MTDAALLSLILCITLVLFVSERVRPDAVALIALLATHISGLVTLDDALSGFGSRAVVVVAAVLVIGRAMEVTGAGAFIARLMIPNSRLFTPKLIGLLVMGALLSAFMNNIAALVITMPAANAIARSHALPPGAVLMPLAFATILGGMTTLIGTPANLILSSVREDIMGQPFRLFDMTLVGGAATLAGLAYLTTIGWRLLPHRAVGENERRAGIPVFELSVPPGADAAGEPMRTVRQRVRAANGVILAVFRGGARRVLGSEEPVEPGDRLLVAARDDPFTFAGKVKLPTAAERIPDPAAVTTRVMVAHGSSLIGHGYARVEGRSEGTVSVVAVGPRPARLRQPLANVRIQAGDQLYLHGRPEDAEALARASRFIEIDRSAATPVAGRPAMLVLAAYAIAVIAISVWEAPATSSFMVAALAICLLRLMPGDEIYRSVDWSIIVLLGAMIPIGRAFEETGAAAIAADWLSWSLQDQPLFWVLAALCAVSMLMSIFLNNVATALIMGQIGVGAARTLGVDIDAALLAVLIGTSCDFLTPIGHQNNLLVMRPGGYRFTDYTRMGAPMTVMVVLITAGVLTWTHG